MVKNIARSPERGTFSLRNYQEKIKLNPEDSASQQMIDWHLDFRKNQELREQTVEWQTDNLEYDLRTNEDLCLKAKHNEQFAQNLYAAMCNNEFIKNQPWNILQDKRWSCSWRHAGGIISDMIQSGDYIDWYCSGILNDISDEEYSQMSKTEQERYIWVKNNYVSESYITDEVRDELHKLGWIVAPEEFTPDI